MLVHSTVCESYKFLTQYWRIAKKDWPEFLAPFDGKHPSTPNQFETLSTKMVKFIMVTCGDKNTAAAPKDYILSGNCHLADAVATESYPAARAVDGPAGSPSGN